MYQTMQAEGKVKVKHLFWYLEKDFKSPLPPHPSPKKETPLPPSVPPPNPSDLWSSYFKQAPAPPVIDIETFGKISTKFLPEIRITGGLNPSPYLPFKRTLSRDSLPV